jgi:2-polyprenyl-3-methyl-5-hydroxy-6-metoxy-1,4-benzoquinol methylase
MSERPYYHEFAWAYDLLQTDPVAPRVDFIEGALSKRGIRAGSLILDAGCGTGRYAIELTRRGYHVWGVDRSKELLAIAQNRALHAAVQVEFLIADLLAVTFTRLFDAVLCRGVLTVC